MREPPGPDIGEQLNAGIEVVAARIAARIDDASRSIHKVILRDIAELGGDQQLVDILSDSVAANVATVLNAVRYRIDVSQFEVPAIATEYARRLAQHNVPLEALVRAYRLGQTEFLCIVFDEVRAARADAQTSLVVAQHIMATTAEYTDWATERVIQAYLQGRERWLIQRNVLRTRHIRRLLAGKYPESESPDSAIDFPLRRRHVAVIAWAEGVPDDTDTYSQIELELRRLREMLPVNGESLLVPADEATIWAWFPLFAHTNSGNVAAAFRSLAQDSNRRIRYAIGSIESGGRGFRVSHTRAQLVRNVMVCADAGNEVGDFADSGMAVTTLLGSDVELARDWVAYVLGPLAEDDPDTARLRETLEIFLTTGSNYSIAAEALHVHPNTVKYRIHKAEGKLPATIGGARIEVALALVLCSRLGTAVLSRRTE